MEEPKNDNSVEYIGMNPKITKSESNIESFDISERNDLNKKEKHTDVDQTKSDNTIKVCDYPTQPPATLDSCDMAVAVGVLVTVIIILMVAIECLYCIKTINIKGKPV